MGLAEGDPGRRTSVVADPMERGRDDAETEDAFHRRVRRATREAERCRGARARACGGALGRPVRCLAVRGPFVCDPWRRSRPEVARHLGKGYRGDGRDRKSTRLNSSHRCISYAVFCLKKKKK